MKLSVSLPGADVEFLDEYAKTRGLESRSAAVQRAVRLLRTSELTVEYRNAFEEWEADGESEVWDRTIADGIG
jgi:Arc/MetJ-type ribon-helix-helix transcriptional regulator